VLRTAGDTAAATAVVRRVVSAEKKSIEEPLSVSEATVQNTDVEKSVPIAHADQQSA